MNKDEWHDKGLMDFLSQYLPNYTSSSQVCQLNVLYKYIDEGDYDLCESDKKWIKETFVDKYDVMDEIAELEGQLFAKAVKNFYRPHLSPIEMVLMKTGWKAVQQTDVYDPYTYLSGVRYRVEKSSEKAISWEDLVKKAEECGHSAADGHNVHALEMKVYSIVILDKDLDEY